jgi:CO dehydrogenase/acetyl-CoA synthase beta subunit
MVALMEKVISPFDIHIEKVNGYVEEMRTRGRQIRVFQAPASLVHLREGLPLRIGPKAGTGVILRDETFIDLGSPQASSSAFLLWTSEPSLIKDGRVTLIGRDIAEAPGEHLPFGQVVMVGGKELSEEKHRSIQYLQFASNRIEGYMARYSGLNLWVRVNKDAAQKGVGLESLGKALIALYKAESLPIETIEVVFVTSGRADVELLNGIAKQVQNISGEIVKADWRSKGYDVDCAFDCAACANSAACDDIRTVLRNRRKDAGKE